MDQINLGVAFLAGILSIFSPCILPVLPSFLAYITGISLEELKGKTNSKKSPGAPLFWQLIINTFFFALGFSLIFLLFGAVIGTLGKFLVINQTVLMQLGGLIIIILAFHQLGIYRLKFLLKEVKFEHQLTNNLKGWLRSLLVGIVFAFGWAPCYGPIVGAILTLAATANSFYYSILLFIFYSFGFLVPLIIFSLFIGFFSEKLKKHRKIFKHSSLVAGLLMLILGVLMLTNLFPYIVTWLSLSYNEANLLYI
ncbi:MAG: cytochrome c biogenesis CcdA family protein [Candidatus Altimarinota bacterium]